MRIGIDFTAAAQPAGIGRYTRSLVGALAAQFPSDRFVLLTPRRPGRAPLRLLEYPNVTLRELPLSERTLTRIWQRLRLPLFADLLTGGADVFYAPDFALPPLWRAPGVITVHDLSYRFFPDSYPASLRRYLERVVPHSIGRARLILADSASTQRDLAAEYNTDTKRISVLHGGVDPAFRPVESGAARAAVLRRYGIASPYFLSVGTIQPRKNLRRVIAALRTVSAAELPHYLVHVGRPGWLYAPILAAPQEYGVAERVRFLTEVDSDEELAALYSGATAFVFPSLYEGFGLPALEAMACGTPVITGNTSSLPEVAGGAALLVDPTDVDAIGAALVTLATDESRRERLSASGRERAAEFTWERAATALRAHLAHAAKSEA